MILLFTGLTKNIKLYAGNIGTPIGAIEMLLGVYLTLTLVDGKDSLEYLCQVPNDF